MPLDWSVWAFLLGLSAGPTLFGYLLFNASLRYLSASIASIFHTLEPAITVLLALLFLSRAMNIFQWPGLSLIIASVIAMQFATLKKSDSNEKGGVDLFSIARLNRALKATVSQSWLNSFADWPPAEQR